jgi:hypothetical protein
VQEELIHQGQHVRAGYKLPAGEAGNLMRLEREVEAQNILLRLANQKNFTQEEIDLLTNNKAYWEGLLRQATGK